MTSSNSSNPVQGPLAGLRVVEFAGIGPGPFACMLLSDMGADVVTVDRPTRKPPEKGNITGRGRTVVIADLKDKGAQERVWALLGKADVLVEGFRPGVMERLGFGPDAVAARNPKLVYGRMTGWGQDGPLAQAAGHDLNYIAITGALHAIGHAGGAPVPPLNLVGDYGGGSMYLLIGILAALHEAKVSGHGQVVDAAITDGTISLMSNFVGHAVRGLFREERGSNMLDGGAPYYSTYETADGEYISIGPIEPQFFKEICERIGVNESLRGAQHERERWQELRSEFTRIFKTMTRAEWNKLLEGSDACFAPVLPLSEARHHPHNVARKAFIDLDGVGHPAPAPRFSRTPGAIQCAAPKDTTPADEVLARWK
jgi:alpha-methylacyl-CoA racemase